MIEQSSRCHSESERLTLSHSKRVCVCVGCCVSDGNPLISLTREDSDYEIGGYMQPSEIPGR